MGIEKAAPQCAGAINAQSLSDYLYECERRYIDQVLRTNAGRISESAAALGISRKNLWEKMKKLNLHGEYTHAGADGRANETRS